MMPEQTIREWPEMLIPFDGSRGAEKVLRRACRTARRDGDRLSVLCVAKLPPDDDEFADPDVEFSTMLALTRAQEICREEGTTAIFNLSHARNLAEAIIADARRSGAALICMSLDEFDEHELGESALMSATVQAVLASAPCSVLLDDPATALPDAVIGNTST
jgi:nucleotide-binding universal stress UspA family protein